RGGGLRRGHVVLAVADQDRDQLTGYRTAAAGRAGADEGAGLLVAVDLQGRVLEARPGEDGSAVPHRAAARHRPGVADDDGGVRGREGAAPPGVEDGRQGGAPGRGALSHAEARPGP